MIKISSNILISIWEIETYHEKKWQPNVALIKLDCFSLVEFSPWNTRLTNISSHSKTSGIKNINIVSIRLWYDSWVIPVLLGPAPSLALCEWNPLVTGGFPSQRASNVESIFMSWHHHVIIWFISDLRPIWSSSITGPLWGESTGDRWFPLTKGQ